MKCKIEEYFILLYSLSSCITLSLLSSCKNSQTWLYVLGCSSFTSFIKTNGSRTRINSVSEQLSPHGAGPFILLPLAVSYILYTDHKFEFSTLLSAALYLRPLRTGLHLSPVGGHILKESQHVSSNCPLTPRFFLILTQHMMGGTK